MNKVRTRFAPSPTGYLHVGGIRTALFAWAYARRHGGQFLLRIEDTDKKREVSGTIEHIKESLEWLGLAPDEEPTIQSERLEIYRQWAQKLVVSGHAYVDPYSEEELASLRQKAEAEKRPFLFRDHRPEDLTVPTDWYKRLPLRFRTQEPKETRWQDAVRGEMHAGAEALDDFILIKRDGFPTYNFAHVIDDHLTSISHVMRGEEFLSSVPKFIALHEALGIQLPVMATMPPILGPTGGKKLSKRDGAKDVLEYREEGYLADAVFNYVASLGWNDGSEQEIFSPQEIVERFSLDRLQRSGARFDTEKLEWINWQQMRRLGEQAPAKLNEHLKKYFSLTKTVKDAELTLACSKANSPQSLIDQLKIFTDFSPLKLAEFDLAQVEEGLTSEAASRYLTSAVAALENIKNFKAADIEQALRGAMAKLQATPRGFLNLVRWCLSGQAVSPNLFEMIEVLGQNEAVKRLKSALE